MKRVMVTMLVVGLAAATARADHSVICEQFDVSKVTRGKGPVTMACAASRVILATPVRWYHRALGMSVPMAVDIPTGGEALVFEASAGLLKTGCVDKVVFTVLGDGKVLWKSPVVERAKKGETPVGVDVRGVSTLTLAVDPVEGGAVGQGVVWGNARLSYPDGKLPPNDVRNNSRQLGILTPPPARQPRVNGARVYGVRPGRPILFRVPATGEMPLKVEVLGLGNEKLKELAYDPVTRILSGHIADRGEYRLTFRATNALGKDEKPFVIKVGDKIGLTPAMGWNSWNCFMSDVTAENVKSAADAMIASGLADHGWCYVNVDDFWQNNPRRPKDPTLSGPERDANGQIVSNARFPSMKDLADYIHAKGLKAGLYSSPGPLTCGGCYGSWQHEEQDAKTYADWGYDYLKHDWCSYGGIQIGKGLDGAMYPYLMMGRALRHQARDINFSLCQYGNENVSAWGRVVDAQSWRTTGDVFDTWVSVCSAIEHQKKLFYYSEPGAWNDADMLCVGPVCWNDFKEPRLAPNEQYTHVSLWALMASPLMIGCDMTKLDPFTFSLLSNDEMIEIDQDELGLGAGCIDEGDDWEIWARPMADGSIAAGLMNKSEREQKVPFDLEKSGLLCKWRVRDVWRQADIGVFMGRYEATVPGHATELLRLFPLPCGKLREGMTDIRDNAWRLLREKDMRAQRK